MREERKVLEGHADIAIFGLSAIDINAGNFDLAVVRFNDACDQTQQYGFTCTRRTEEDKRLTLWYLQRHAINDFVVLEAFAEIGEFKRHDLPLHRAKRQTFDEVALGIKRKCECGCNRQHYPGGNLSIVDT